jgi:translation elongation factor EF-1beta
MKRMIHLLLLAAVLLPPAAWAAPETATKTPPNVFMFLATGPSGEAELARLREALARVDRVTNVEAHAGGDGAVVLVSVDGESPMSLLAAAGKTVGFLVRPAPTRFYTAAGPTGDADRTRLQEALRKVRDAGQVEVSQQPAGAAVRIIGAAPTAVLAAVAKSVGFGLRQLGAFVVSGPSAEDNLERLRSALGDVAGVEEVEMRGLTGGATLIIYGDVNHVALVKAAKDTGYTLWPLSDAVTQREFRIDSTASAMNHQLLQEALRNVEEIGKVEIRSTADGFRLIVSGGRARPREIVGAATAAGFALTPVTTVTPPTLEPKAGRGTPPDFDERVLDEFTEPGAPAPDFALLSKDGQSTIRLSDYRGKKPVVLMFGSCT